LGFDGSLRFGGEVAMAQYSGRWALRAAVGFVPGRLYFEAQPALVLGDHQHNLVLGLNPGFVIDVTANVPRYGGQATLWANYVHVGARLATAPLHARAGGDGDGLRRWTHVEAARAGFVMTRVMQQR
jgi:hypothetical protein